MGFSAGAGAGVEAARAGRGVSSPHNVSPEYDRVMLTAADLGGLRKPLGVAGAANGVVGGGIEEGFASFEWWNRGKVESIRELGFYCSWCCRSVVSVTEWGPLTYFHPN